MTGDWNRRSLVVLRGLKRHREVHLLWVRHLQHCAGCPDCAAHVVKQVGNLATHQAHVEFYGEAIALIVALRGRLPA